MPALALDPAFDEVFHHGASILARQDAANETIAKTWEVVCAWPVSGQYGPGTRILFVDPSAVICSVVCVAPC